MVKIGQEIESKKGKGIVRGMFGLYDGRICVIAEHKNKNFVLIEGDDF
jgi:hypothetical protein